MKILNSFKTLLYRISPLPSELEHAKGHAATIKSRIGSSFNLKSFIVVGSHSRETAIRHYSDVDYFAVLSRDDARWGYGYVSSSTLLNNIRADLADRFWQTDIARDGQAVVVNFRGGGYPVDVVPAIFWDMKERKWPIYQIPDGNGGWMVTSPQL